MSRFIPQNAPADPSTGSTRKLTIYYQQRTDDSAVESSERPNTDGPAVAPTLDGSTDVARPVLRKLVAHVTQMTVDGQNAIPLEPTFNIRPASGDDANQPRYVSQNEQLNVSKIDPTPFVSPATMWNPQAFEAVGLSNTEADFGAKKNVLGSSAPVDNGKTKSLKAYLSSGKHGKFIDQQLLETTGFNEEHKFLNPTGDGTQPDTKLELGSVFYNQLGAYAKTSYVGQPTISGQTVAAKRLTVEDMQILALNSLFDASQGGADFDFVVTKDNTVEAEARAAVPSPTRLGKKISLGRFSGARELKKVYGIDKGSRTTFIDNTDSLETYGSFYSPYSQFNTLVPTGQVAVAVALVVAFTLVLESVGFLVQQGSGDGTIVGYASLSTQEKADLLGTSVLKSSTVYPKGKITSGLDFLRDVSGVTTLFDTVQHNRGDCLFAGLEEFFGFRLLGNFNATGNTAAVQQLATASSKILTESGRISTLLREILRSGIGLLSDVAAIPSEGFSVAGASALLERLKRLKLVSFINVLMNLGDRVLQNQDIVQDAADNGNPDYNTDGRSTVSFIDSLPDVRRNYIAKSRLSKNGKLAWGMSTTSMLSLPLGSLYNPGAGTNRNLREAGVSLVEGYPDVINTDGNEQPNFRTAGDRNQAVRSGRISADMVAKYEQSLESDYMPFYIHDLRTNEIVQFHAFLEDVGEDFSVEYTAQEGYGRQDKVQTHRGTTRTVTVSFKMVATNEDDHSVMWYKLNKLVTMIYPQWTQGREVNVDNVRFIQPFSQIPGASPVVRLRLGDLFKTNFSKMAVARLFGATTLSTFNVQGNRVAPTADGRTSSRDGSVPTGATTTTDSTSANSALMYGPVSILNSQNLTIMARAATAVGLSPVVTPDQLFQPGDKLVLKPEVLSQYLRGYSASNTPFTKLITQESRIVAEYVRTDSQTSKVVLQLKNYIRDIRVGGSSFLGNNDIGGYPTVPINAQAGTSPTLQLPLNTSNVFARALDQQRTARELQKRIDSSQNRTVRDEQQVVTGQPTTSGSVSTARNTSTAGLESLTGQQFFSETENPVLKAFKSSGGQGLAGVITSFKVDYSEAKGSWSTDGSTKSRAPKFVTVNLGMSVIHDITPGLDANGIMTAPVWPVGPYSNYYMNNGNTTTPPTANDAQSVSAQGNINRFNPLSNPTLNRKG
jgi:hypothetical protein